MTNRHTLRAAITAFTAAGLILTGAGVANAENLPGATLNLSARETTLYPYHDGYKDLAGFYLTAQGGTPTPGADPTITGSLTITAGGKTLTTPYSANPQDTDYDDNGKPFPAVSVNITSLPVGPATAVATYLATDGTTVTSNPITLNLKETAVTKVSTTRNHTTIYPVKDGYRDTASIKIAGTTTTGTTLAVKGTAKLTRKGHTVKSWKLTKSTQTITWNGRYKNKVVPGTYTLTVTEKAAQGSTHTTKTTIAVNGKHLVTRTTTSKYTARSIYGTQFHSNSQTDPAQCYYDAYTSPYTRTPGALYCQGGAADYNENNPYTAVLTGSKTIPAKVRHATTYGTPTAKVTQTSNIQSGSADIYLSTGSAYKITAVHNGRHASSVKVHTGDTKLAIQYGFQAYAVGGTKDYTITYTYKALA